MKKLMFLALFGAALTATSCDKEGGKCECSYTVTVGGLESKVDDVEVDLAGTNMTCAEYEEGLTGKYSDVRCKADN